VIKGEWEWEIVDKKEKGGIWYMEKESANCESRM